MTDDTHDHDARPVQPAVPSAEPVTAFCDGACLGNFGNCPGGWAVLLRQGGEERLLSGRDPSATNNTMELTAAIRALEETAPGAPVMIVTDSEYVVKGMMTRLPAWKKRGWKTAGKKPVKNRALWERLDELAGERQARWEWVRGHSRHPENEQVDAAANAEAQKAAEETGWTPAARYGFTGETSAVDADVGAAAVVIATATAQDLLTPHGGYGTIVVFPDGRREVRTGTAGAASRRREALKGIIAGLEVSPPEVPAAIYCSDSDAFRPLRLGWLKGWKERDWRKTDGFPAPDADLYRRIDELAAGRRVEWGFTPEHGRLRLDREAARLASFEEERVRTGRTHEEMTALEEKRRVLREKEAAWKAMSKEEREAHYKKQRDASPSADPTGHAAGAEGAGPAGFRTFNDLLAKMEPRLRAEEEGELIDPFEEPPGATERA